MDSAHFFEDRCVPVRAALANVQRQGDGVVFLYQLPGHAHMAVGAIRGDGAVLGALAADIGGVVCVKVQQKPVPAQHPEPLTVGLFRVRQGPGQVSAEDHIEAALREVRLLGVHLPEVDG